MTAAIQPGNIPADFQLSWLSSKPTIPQELNACKLKSSTYSNWSLTPETLNFVLIKTTAF